MAQKPLLTQEELKEKLKEKLQVSNFEPNSIIRGAQLTVVGGKLRHFDKSRSISLLEQLTDNYYSIPSTPKPSSLHLGPLQASCHSRGYWHRYPPRNLHSREKCVLFTQRDIGITGMAGYWDQDLALVLVFPHRFRAVYMG